MIDAPFISTGVLYFQFPEVLSYVTAIAPSGRLKSAGKVLSSPSVVKASSIFFTRVLSKPSPSSVGISLVPRAATPADVFRFSSVLRTEFAEPALSLLNASQSFWA